MGGALVVAMVFRDSVREGSGRAEHAMASSHVTNGTAMAVVVTVTVVVVLGMNTLEAVAVMVVVMM